MALKMMVRSWPDLRVQHERRGSTRGLPALVPQPGEGRQRKTALFSEMVRWPPPVSILGVSGVWLDKGNNIPSMLPEGICTVFCCFF